jgi:3-deoxy-D-manno-octulosonic acid kinase
MINGGQRIASATGVMLADPAELGNSLLDAAGALFDPKFWTARDELVRVPEGRGSAWFIGAAAKPWVLRHYRRGGFIAKVSIDGYVWAGEERVRAFAEWRLLLHLSRLGLPVPKPVAAGYRRRGLMYRCDLITRRIADTQTLSAILAQSALAEDSWQAIGAVIARLHRAGVDHADLNAHNILLDANGAVSVIDFDRGRLRAAGAWHAQNLRRLHRSLVKVTGPGPADRFQPSAWEALLRGYRTP